MKIVFLAPFGLRPKGTVLARMVPLAAELQTLGHEVVIVAPPYTNPEDSERTEMVRGVRLVNIRLVAGSRAVAAPGMAWRMVRAAQAEKPDWIHLFKPKGYGGLAAMLLVVLRRLGRRCPRLFVDTDDWEGQGGIEQLQSYGLVERTLYRFQEQWLPRQAAGVTVASRELARLMAEIGIRQEKILYLPNCVTDVPPGDGNVARGKLGIALNSPVVLLYTRFFEFNQDRLHGILAGIRQKVPDVRIVVVGKGRHGEESLLLRTATERGFADALTMAGWVEPQALPDLLTMGDVALYPMDDTLYNRAKCPAKLTELMLAERAVVADGVGQCAEYIADGASGVLCDPARPEQMIAAVVELLGNRERAATLGRAARQRILATFNWHDQAARLAEFYVTSQNLPLSRERG